MTDQTAPNVVNEQATNEIYKLLVCHNNGLITDHEMLSKALLIAARTEKDQEHGHTSVKWPLPDGSTHSVRVSGAGHTVTLYGPSVTEGLTAEEAITLLEVSIERLRMSPKALRVN